MVKGERTLQQWWTEHYRHIEDGDPVEVDVMLQSLAPPQGTRQRQEQVFQRLDELREEGSIDMFRVNLWGGNVCLCDVCRDIRAGERVRERIEEFETWATENEGVTLPFERKDVHSEVLGDTTSEIAVPNIVLALYTDAELVGVFPNQTEGRYVSAADCLQAIGTWTEPPELNKQNSQVQT